MNEIPLDEYKEICEDFCSFAIWYAMEHPCVACSVVTRVISIRSELSTAIIKKVLKRVKKGLKDNDPGMNQDRIQWCKLYDYLLLELYDRGDKEYEAETKKRFYFIQKKEKENEQTTH